MPEIGEIRRYTEIGKKSKFDKVIWAKCPNCGIERWTNYQNQDSHNTLCRNCAAIKKRTIPRIPPEIPKEGDVYVRGTHNYYIWKLCIDCGIGRWTTKCNPRLRCTKCANIANRKVHITNNNPPYIGEIRNGIDIGKYYKRSYIWTACDICGNTRWIRLKKGKPENTRCRKCDFSLRVKDNSRSWKGEKRNALHSKYKLVSIYPDSFYYSMGTATKSKYSLSKQILEHRLIMAQHLGRCLQDWEIVHHKNGDKLDNRIDNLELSSKGSHTIAHSKGYKDGYEQGLKDAKDTRIKELEKEILWYREKLTFELLEEIGYHSPNKLSTI